MAAVLQSVRWAFVFKNQYRQKGSLCSQETQFQISRSCPLLFLDGWWFVAHDITLRNRLYLKKHNTVLFTLYTTPFIVLTSMTCAKARLE